VQPLNASFPILVTLSGMVTEINEVQDENALFPILFTVFGTIILRILLFKKHITEIFSTHLGITTDFNYLVVIPTAFFIFLLTISLEMIGHILYF
jgi:hypothetical protein